VKGQDPLQKRNVDVGAVALGIVRVFPVETHCAPAAFALSRIAVARGKSDQRFVWRKDIPLLVATSFGHSLSARVSQSNTSLTM